MQLTINIYDMGSQELEHVEAIIRLRKEKVLGYEEPVLGSDTSTEKLVSEPHQPSLPFDGEIDTTRQPKPVKENKTRVKRTETALEDTKDTEEVSEPTSEEKTPTIDLAALKELAQTMVAKTDRQQVKDVITKYAIQLSKVDPSDYEALKADLEALGA